VVVVDAAIVVVVDAAIVVVVDAAIVVVVDAAIVVVDDAASAATVVVLVVVEVLVVPGAIRRAGRMRVTGLWITIPVSENDPPHELPTDTR
jgi:hypothetical protein